MDTHARKLQRIAIFAAFFCVLCFGSACKSRQNVSGGLRAPMRPARINHVVFFKLNNPNDAAELIADCDRLLATIPGVVSYYAGQHLDTGRATVDGNYDVGLYIGFNTEADYAVYVDHPNHVAGVDKWKPRWEWIKIFDVMDETP